MLLFSCSRASITPSSAHAARHAGRELVSAPIPRKSLVRVRSCIEDLCGSEKATAAGKVSMSDKSERASWAGAKAAACVTVIGQECPHNYSQRVLRALQPRKERKASTSLPFLSPYVVLLITPWLEVLPPQLPTTRTDRQKPPEAQDKHRRTDSTTHTPAAQE